MPRPEAMNLNHRRLGSGAPLVLLHGIGSRWQVWGPVLGRLAQEREVIALDLPGFAASPPPRPGTPAGIASLTELVAGFLAGIGLERPHVAGNSLGGWISLELAKRGQARSVAALSPAGFHEGWEKLYQRASLRLAARSARFLAPRAEAVVAHPIGRRLAYGQYAARPGAISAADAAESIRALAGAHWFDATLEAVRADRFRDGDRISVPVTIAWGARDRLLLPRQASRAAREIPGARVLTLHGCGHLPMYDDPERVARVLLDASAES